MPDSFILGNAYIDFDAKGSEKVERDIAVIGARLNELMFVSSISISIRLSLCLRLFACVSVSLYGMSLNKH